ncbi:LacI family DNA-binding transcriptional regulator [Nocardia sp. SYP-A9097]|uniref:LacI family DNA-binding transcriptional regulator n=1 Tax=Nocardia sp. SYP-A9097 TaxID=2663237 RepID=UPI00129AB490|nr:LacI family DNA-binding transcriptional regulator [Nocardia sp. SYP-A9097]MRH87940.1 LacI family DNA-binding transcriptional regulator [Nocardia sp. SYP-A9097]
MSRPDPRVRLVDVARAAGVSKTTVSDALNGSGRLPDATRDHVRETARLMGYRPNATARLLRAGHTRLLGLAAREYVETSWVYTDMAYFSQLVTASTRTALAHGYGVVLLPTTSPGDHWVNMPLDGVCVVDPVDGDPMVADFLSAGVPVVSDRRALANLAGPLSRWVDFDYGAATRTVLDHLKSQGAQRIVLVSARSTASYNAESEHAYRDWCTEHHLDPMVTMVTIPGPDGVRLPVDEALAMHPDAIFTLAEVSPLMLLDAVRRAGRTAPDDLLLVCTSEDPSAAYTDPPLSTLSYLPKETSEASVDLLIDIIEGRKGVPGKLFDAHLEVRASSFRSAARVDLLT